MSDRLANPIAFVNELSTNFGERSLSVNGGQIPVATLALRRIARPGYQLTGLQRQMFEKRSADCVPIIAPRAFVVSVPGLTLTLDYGHFVAAAFLPRRSIHCCQRTHVHVRAGAPGKLQITLNGNTIDFAGIVSRLSKR